VVGACGEKEGKLARENVQGTLQTALAIAALSTNYKLSMKKGAKVQIGWIKPPERKAYGKCGCGF